MKDSVFQKRFQRKQQNRQVHGQQLTVFYRDMVSCVDVKAVSARVSIARWPIVWLGLKRPCR